MNRSGARTRTAGDNLAAGRTAHRHVLSAGLLGTRQGTF